MVAEHRRSLRGHPRRQGGELGGRPVVILTFGPPHAVCYNLVPNPHVELRVHAIKRDYRAREVTGHEKALWSERAVAAFPPYADDQRKTRRQIPVFVLEPMEPDA